MPFKNGPQGNLVYQLAADEQVDQDAYNMLRNNSVQYLVPVSYKQFDDRRELHYDTSGMQIASEYIARREFGQHQFADMLMGVVEVFGEASEYMLSENAFVSSLERAYVDEQHDIRLLYVPIAGFSGGSGALPLLRDMRRSIDVRATQEGLAVFRQLDELLSSSDAPLADIKKTLARLTFKPSPTDPLGLNSGQGFAPARTDMQAPQPFGSVAPEGAVQGSVAVPGASPSPLPGSGGSVGGFTPNAAGAPSNMGGVIVPPANGGSAPGGMVIPGGGAVPNPAEGGAKKKGLFSKKPKDDKPASGKKLSKEQKKQAKLAEKAQKKAEKEQKKAEKRKSKGGSAGNDAAKKKSRLPWGGSKDIQIPYGDTAPGNGGIPIPGAEQGGVPIPGASQGSGSVSQGVGSMPNGQAPGGMGANGASAGYQGQQSAPSGDYYSDDDFGVTAVYGIEPNRKAPDSGSSSQGSVSVPKPDFNDAAAGSTSSFHGEAGEYSAGFGEGMASVPKPSIPIAAYLVRVSTGEKRLIDKTPFKVGRRKSEVDFYIADKPKVSRTHGIIVFDGKVFRISDNDTTNHTFVNGTRLGSGERVALVDGDKIELGDEAFTFVLG